MYYSNMKTQKLTEFRDAMTDIFREVNSTGEPVMVTSYGNPYVVVIPVPAHLKHDPKAVADAGVADLDTNSL